MSKYPIKFDLTGQRFERLLVLERKDINNHVAWLCRCDCGKTKNLRSQDLRRTKSCGCYQIERTKISNIQHGKKGSRSYNTWQSMKSRCLNLKDKNYQNYGARGIKICNEWLDFNLFYKDMGDPEKGMTLDRIDNTLGYSKENCRWADAKTQCNNRRTDSKIQFRGEFLNKLELFEKYMKPLGFTHPSVLYRRLEKGIPIEIALFSSHRIVPKKYNTQNRVYNRDTNGKFIKNIGIK